MKKIFLTKAFVLFCKLYLMLFGEKVSAQISPLDSTLATSDTLIQEKKNIHSNSKGSIRYFLYGSDETWPQAKYAVRTALIFPGGGQLYNRSYWKIPIVWAGIGTCVYFARQNHLNYLEFRQNYIENPNNNGLRVNRDSYRRSRDFMIILTGLTYALSIIEAYTDSHLKHFDVSDDLSMRINPCQSVSSQAGGLSIGPSIRILF